MNTLGLMHPHEDSLHQLYYVRCQYEVYHWWRSFLSRKDRSFRNDWHESASSVPAHDYPRYVISTLEICEDFQPKSSNLKQKGSRLC